MKVLECVGGPLDGQTLQVADDTHAVKIPWLVMDQGFAAYVYRRSILVKPNEPVREFLRFDGRWQ